MREFDPPIETERVVSFIRGYMQNSGFGRVVLGLSGGVDSAVCAALAVRALGAANVTALAMPYRTSHPDSLDDALQLAEDLGIACHKIEITPLVDVYFDSIDQEASQLRRGNWMARIRMNILFDHSAKLSALVLGTSNRTELMVGYFTQYGDSACAFEPIGHLYKTEIWQLARSLKISPKIINKAPSADLWQGQTDEADLSMPYGELDEILYELTELDLDFRSSQTLKYPLEQYQRVDRLIRVSEFKRHLPPLPA